MFPPYITPTLFSPLHNQEYKQTKCLPSKFGPVLASQKIKFIVTIPASSNDQKLTLRCCFDPPVSRSSSSGLSFDLTAIFVTSLLCFIDFDRERRLFHSPVTSVSNIPLKPVFLPFVYKTMTMLFFQNRLEASLHRLEASLHRLEASMKPPCIDLKPPCIDLKPLCIDLKPP